MYEFFTPEVKVEIGSYIIEKHMSLEIRLDDEKSFDWATITLTKELLNVLKIVQCDRARIYLGYSGNLEQVFVGNVVGVTGSKIYIRNDFMKLARTAITQNFVKCTPQEVIGFILNKAGIESFELNTEPYPMKDLLSISNQTGLEALKYIDQKWQINHSICLFRGEHFEWNMLQKENEIYQFNYGDNILDLQNSCPMQWDLTTILVPMIKVLSEIEINHPKLQGIFKVYVVSFSVDENGFARTKLTFKE